MAAINEGKPMNSAAGWSCWFRTAAGRCPAHATTLTIVLAALIAAASPASGSPQAGEASSAQGPAPVVPDPEAEGEAPAAVMLGGEPVVWISAGTGAFTPRYRAERITSGSRRLSTTAASQIPA